MSNSDFDLEAGEGQGNLSVDETAQAMLTLLMKQGGSPVDMLNTMTQLNGMFCCGMAFSVMKTKSTRAKAYQVQMDIAKATRAGIEHQTDEGLEMLSFEPLFSREH